MTEIWKAIPGYAGHEVSSLGRVRSIDGINTREVKDKRYSYYCKGRILTPHKDEDGYFHLLLNEGGTRIYVSVHRLVALAFIPNPDNLPQVNHKDENKTNNAVDNLEWCSAKYNTNYGTASERRSKTISQGVVAMDKDGNIIKVYSTQKEAAKDVGGVQANISRSIKKGHFYKGFYWRRTE